MLSAVFFNTTCPGLAGINGNGEGWWRCGAVPTSTVSGPGVPFNYRPGFPFQKQEQPGQVAGLTYSNLFVLFQTYIDLFRKITQTQLAAILIAVICIVILYLTKEYVNPKVKARIKMPVPIELIVVSTVYLVLRFKLFKY